MSLLGRGRLWAGALLACIALQAQAESLVCGTVFRSTTDAGSTLRVVNAQQIEPAHSGAIFGRHLYQVRDGDLYTLDPDVGVVRHYRIKGDDLVEIDDEGMPGDRLSRDARLPCEPDVVLPPPGRCRNDLAHCEKSVLDKSDLGNMREVCEEGIGYGCKTFLRTAARPPELDREPPEALKRACDEKARNFNKADCEAAIGNYIGQAFTAGIAAAFGSPPPIPAAILDELPALCKRSRSGEGCAAFADTLLAAGRFAPWLDTQTQACAFDDNQRACPNFPRTLQRLRQVQAFSPSNAVPCGRFVALNEADTLYGELDFQDRGRVTISGFSTRRARVEDGVVKVRHDKGADFVFRAAGDMLIGTDTWTQGNVYVPASGGASHCQPPPRYREVAMPTDCPVVSPAEVATCCDAGKLQGCNTRGNQSALAGNWDAAARDYTRLCRANIRIGCENLARAAVELNDEAPEERLKAICDADSQAVACDVLEMTDWDAQGVQKALNEILRDIEKEDSDASPEDRP